MDTILSAFLCSIQTAAKRAPLPLTLPDILHSAACCPATVLLAHVQVIIYYMVLLSKPSPVEAEASPAICNKYTGAATRAACQQLYAGLFHGQEFSAGSDGPAAAMGGEQHATHAPWHTAASGGPSLGQQDSAQPTASGSAVLVASMSSATGYNRHRHRLREEEYGEQLEHWEPWYYHVDEYDYSSSGEHEKDPYPPKQLAAKGIFPGPDNDHKGQAISPTSDLQADVPPAPSIPLHSSSAGTVVVVVSPTEGSRHAIGELTPDNFESWRE